MPTIAENLKEILQEKNNLKKSINAKNAGAITDSTPFSAYPNSISAIETRTLDMSDRVVSDCIELKDYTDSAFTVKKCVKEINIPTTVTSLVGSCFFNCSSLSAITIPDSVTSLGSSCFNSCTSLSAITIPDSVTSLGDSCFNSCTSLSAITIPDSVTSLGQSCFSNCSSLTGITIPDGVTLLDYNCFQDCTSLSSITIPNSLTELRQECFSNCSSLTAITIPDLVTRIPQECFYYCTSLSAVTIGNSVTLIEGSYWFYACFCNCSKLTYVTCKATTPPTLEGNAFYGCSSLSVIYVPEESIDAYKSATNWSSYADKIQAIA